MSLLAQVADLVCTATLIELKLNSKNLSQSEKRVLGSDRGVRRNLLKPIKKKAFESRR